jgi:TonB family protein
MKVSVPYIWMAMFALPCAHAVGTDRPPSDQAASDIAAAEQVALAYAEAIANDRWDEALGYFSDASIKEAMDPVYSRLADDSKRIDELGMMRLFGGSYGEVTTEHLRRLPEKDLFVILVQSAMGSLYSFGIDFEVGPPVILKSTARDPSTVDIEMLQKVKIEGIEQASRSVCTVKKENGAWKLAPEQDTKTELDPEVRAAIQRKLTEKKDGAQCASRLEDAVFAGYKNLNEDFPKKYRGKAKFSHYGTCYAGDFRNGRPDGTGVYIFTDGPEYSGEIRRALPHGAGRFTDASGWTYQGSWKDGMPVAGKCSFKGNTVSCEVTDQYKPIYLWRPYQRFMPKAVAGHFAGLAENYGNIVEDIRKGLTKPRPLERSLITSGITRGSGGINTAVLSRDVAGSGLDGERGTGRVTGYVSGADLADAAKAPDADSSPGYRTDREIQDVFDKNKSALYSIYQRALRHDPALQGKVVLKLTIAPSGEVTAVSIESSELGDPEFERKLSERVKRFDFGPDGGEPLTITYPIDFLPT